MILEGLAASFTGKISDKIIDDFLYPGIKNILVKATTGSSKHKGKAGISLLKKIKDNESYNDFVTYFYLRNLKVKTISRKNEAIFIDDIYVDISLDRKLNINHIKDDRSNIVKCIIGVAGQGKSTLMKKILIDLIRDGELIPIFIELKDIGDDSIIEHISKELSKTNIDNTKDDVISLLYSGKVILLLDGFDETHSSLRKGICDEIDTISSKYKCKTIISSRPETEICYHHLTTNSVYSLLNMEETSILDLVSKLIQPDILQSVINILKNNEDLMDSLRTPILVSLFCASYPYSDTVPNTAKKYYDRIFDVMYEGHDKDKGYNDREKNFTGDISEIKKIFNAFSYGTFIDGKGTYNRDYAVDMLEKTASATGLSQLIPQRYGIFDDLVKVTSLVIPDGLDNFAFIHKTIQEYHAALYIQSALPNKKERYQNKIKERLLSGDSSYISICSFLYQSDKENTSKYIMLPLMEVVGFSQTVEIKDITKGILDRIISKANIRIISHKVDKIKKEKKSTKVRKTYMYSLNSENVVEVPLTPFLGYEFFHKDWFHEKIKKIVSHAHLDWLRNKTLVKKDKADEEYTTMSASEFIDEMGLYEDIFNSMTPSVEYINSFYKNEKNRLDRIELDNDIF